MGTLMLCDVLAGFDIRIPPSVDLSAFKAQLDEWAAAEVCSLLFKEADSQFLYEL